MSEIATVQNCLTPSSTGLVGREATLCLQDQPTNQPTGPTEYLSIRLTLSHAQVDQVCEFFDYYGDYCIYLHKGGTSNEHYHVCLPGLSGGDTERVRNRIKKRYVGVKHAIKQFTNGVRSFMFYCGHEGLEPKVKGIYWEEVRCTIDKYFVKDQGQLMLPIQKDDKKDKDSDWQLTYANLVPKAINHARKNGLTGGLKEVLRHMLEHSRWRPSFHMVKNGVPEFYYKDYEFRSGKRQKFDMDWMNPKF